MKGWARRREEGRRRRGLHFLACAPNESPHYKQKTARQIIHGLRFLRRSTISVVRTAMEGRDGTILSPPLKAASHCLRHGSPRSLRDGLVSWRKTQMFCRKEKVPFNCFHRKEAALRTRGANQEGLRHHWGKFSPATGEMCPIVWSEWQHSRPPVNVCECLAGKLEVL